MSGLRVLIELFDRNPIHNVLGACIFKPNIVVFLCDTRDAGFFKESAVYRLFKRRKLKTQPRFYYFDASDPVGIRRVLGAVVRDYPGCVFDFSGGRDLVLLVAGACFAELQLPGFYIELPAGRFINMRGCQAEKDGFALPAFTAEDIFAMAGATVHGHGHFPTGQMDADFERDVLATWEVVQHNTKAWSEFVSWLQAVCNGSNSGELRVDGPRRVKGGRGGSHANPVLLNRLKEAGVLTRVDIQKHRVELKFKSALHRRCLLIEGVWLELYGYVSAKNSGLFDDVRTSIIVDWDGVEGGADNAKNEVDIFLVKGVTPIFISCKMSLPTALAMSEIRLLATKFGGRHSRAVVLTAGVLGEEHKALRQRAAELEITMLDKNVLARGGLVGSLIQLVNPPPVPKAQRLVDSRMLPQNLPDGLGEFWPDD